MQNKQFSEYANMCMGNKDDFFVVNTTFDLAGISEVLPILIEIRYGLFYDQLKEIC